MSGVSPVGGIPGALQSATGAIQRATKSLDKDESVVARSQGVEQRDTVAAMVDSRQQLLYTRAAAKIISTTDEMLQSLINTRA
jgi:homogentisate 1,2-dioxygenase